MAYRVTLDTSGYIPKPCSEKNWEVGTLNDYMKAINGWKCRESNYKELVWRLEFILHRSYNLRNESELEYYKEWIGKKKNRIKYRDCICDMYRTEDVLLPGIPQGYVDLASKLGEFKKTGKLTMPFSEFYDMRQSLSKIKGCYIIVEKV